MWCAAATPTTATGWRRSPANQRVAAIWVVSDGKPGHLNQSLGLAEALQRVRPDLDCELIAPLPFAAAAATWWRRRPPALPAGVPALLLCAGHATHLSVLALARLTAAPSVVLMRPSLPLSWFDYALLPRHDRPLPRATTLPTEGAINRLQPAAKRANSGLILLGGPSRHYRWEADELIDKVAALAAASDRQWLLSGSRRTPQSTLDRLAARALDNIELVPLAAQPAGWLAAQLAVSEQCWVSCDSVSMVYEALTAGCQTGLLALPSLTANNRLAVGLNELLATGRVVRFDDRLPPLPPASRLNEAERAAAWLLAQPAVARRLVL